MPIVFLNSPKRIYSNKNGDFYYYMFFLCIGLSFNTYIFNPFINKMQKVKGGKCIVDI